MGICFVALKAKIKILPETSRKMLNILLIVKKLKQLLVTVEFK